jgi:site-specific DNA-cytosine methylase
MFYGNSSEVRKQVGNAISSLGAKKIGKVILDILNDI